MGSIYASENGKTDTGNAHAAYAIKTIVRRGSGARHCNNSKGLATEELMHSSVIVPGRQKTRMGGEILHESEGDAAMPWWN